MHDVNWWLMALAFVLGLLLTFAMMIRRVTREVPVKHSVSAGLRGAEVAKPRLEKPDLKAESGKVGGAVAAAGTAAAAAGAAARLHGAADKVGEKVERVEKVVADRVDHAVDHVIEKEPYGAGSIRVSRRTAAPAGHTIKGDKDTGRYFTLDSPDYAVTEAEVWFADEASAEKAGFLRWDAKGDRTAMGLTSAAAATVVKAGDSVDVTMVVKGSGSAPSESAVRIVAVDEVAAGRYGKGSVKAGADGSGPAGWLIKGNADSMLYHGPDSPAYEQTIAEFWFFDEATARAAGFDKWDKNFK
jgi:hypothetical protein